MAVELVRDVENALSRDIDTLDWMTPGTKREAKKKLQAIRQKWAIQTAGGIIRLSKLAGRVTSRMCTKPQL
jgi:hypothetical protein